MDLTTYVPTAISEIQARFGEAKRDPTMLIKTALEVVQEVTESKAVLVDATNPMVMLMEMGAVLSANCVQENQALLRRQYAALAVTEHDLYYHMSDDDYLNRFASPAFGKFFFAIQKTDLLRQMVKDEAENTYKVVIPRDTVIQVDGIAFTLMYPIVVRRYENDVVQISYDPEIINPLYALKNTIISYSVRRGTNLEDWLFFEVEAPQIVANTNYFVLDRSYNFRKEIVFSDSYYAVRAFYQNENTQNAWVELATTHTDQVFDVTVPTVVLKVLTDSVIVEVPVIYLSTGVLSGQLRIDVYTTKGLISVNLKNYRQDTFEVTLRAIDEVRDLSVYTEAMADVSYYVYSLDTVSGGKASIDFDTLRQRVIYNAIGPQNLPITNVQLQADAENKGFTIVSNIDVLTNRVFLATRKLPAPTNTKLITPANIGIVTCTTTLEEIKDNFQVVNNGNRMTILSKAVWLSLNSRLTLLGKSDIMALSAMNQSAMVSLINVSQYLYTPFYYVLDASGSEFEIRAYALDQPYAKDLNFVRQNQTLQLFVNTGTYQLTKTTAGFTLRILTKSGNFYKQMSDSQVGVQLAFNPKGETTYAYINGVIESHDSAEERVLRFDINTNHDLNSDGLICITNSTVQGVTDYKAWIDLETTFNLLHHTNSLTESFVADETDAILGKFMLPVGSVGNSQEKLTLHFGDALDTLWKRSRSYLTDKVYRTHQVDVPLLYEADVLDIDPVTGSAFTIANGELVYKYLHHEGDPVLSASGDPVFKYRIGDVLLDEQGDPVYDIDLKTGREFDIAVIDARYYFANDAATSQYRQEVEETLVAWITDDVKTLQAELLEQTRIYFYPKTTLGMIPVETEDGGTDYLQAEQAFTVTLYVQYAIYNDTSIRDTLRASTVKLLDTYISKSIVNMTELFGQLKSLYGESVAAFRVDGLGGAKNYQFVTIPSESNKLCLKKQLSIQADKTMVVEDAVLVEFKLVN